MSAEQKAVTDDEFYLSVLVDFADDALGLHYTPEKVEQMMSIFKEMGIKRVYWIYYGGARCEMFWSGHGSNENSRKTIASLGGMDMQVAVKAAKKAGLEIYGCIKPYDTGLSYTVPQGSPEASQYEGVPCLGGTALVVMKFVREHPEMRIKRKMADIPPNIDSIPICCIKLIKKDDSPTRIKKENIEIWTSSDNYQYKRKEINFTIREAVEKAENGKKLTAKGSPVRVIYIDGLNLLDKYILLTTNFKDSNGDFVNFATDMIEAYGNDERKLPVSIATEFAPWNPNRNFRTYGLEFDAGGFCEPKTYLDLDNSSSIKGFIAFCRGKNEYNKGALCEAYPEVRQFWLSLVKDCLEAGVDGIDFRVQGHSTWTDEPFSYGFNEPIVKDYKNRYGVDILMEHYDPNLLADLRGEYYTEFLKDASSLIRSANKKMQVHIDTDLLSPNLYLAAFTFPMNIKFDWEKWISEGICDEATLRSLEIGPDQISTNTISHKVIAACWKKSIPLHFNRYITEICVSSKGSSFEELIREIEIIRGDGIFRSFILYEGANLIGQDGNEAVSFRSNRYGTMQQWKQRCNSKDIRNWDRSFLKNSSTSGGTELDAKWKFMWDPNDDGLNKEWFFEKYDYSKWFDIGTNSCWEEQSVGKQWEQQHGKQYDGFGWYRNQFIVPSSDSHKKIQLGFGAVDEACKIWINGQLVLDRPFPYKGDADSWRQAFDVDITEYVHFNKPNMLAVRVEDNSGGGGIWRPVKLLISEAKQSTNGF